MFILMTFTGFHKESFFGNHVHLIFGDCIIEMLRHTTGCRWRFAKGLSQSWKWTGAETLETWTMAPEAAVANWRSLAKMKPWRSMISVRPTRSRMVTDGDGWSRRVMVVFCEIMRISVFVAKIEQVFSDRCNVTAVEAECLAMISLGTAVGSECTRATSWNVVVFEL